MPRKILAYNVYYSLDKTVNRGELTKAGSTDSTEFIVSGLFNGTEYHFVVSAEDTLGFEGPFSEMVSAVPKYGGPNCGLIPLPLLMEMVVLMNPSIPFQELHLKLLKKVTQFDSKPVHILKTIFSFHLDTWVALQAEVSISKIL